MSFRRYKLQINYNFFTFITVIVKKNISWHLNKSRSLPLIHFPIYNSEIGNRKTTYFHGGIWDRSQWGEVRQVVSPTIPFPLSLPSPFPFPLSFQTNQCEGRSDPVRGKFPGFPHTNSTLLISYFLFSVSQIGNRKTIVFLFPIPVSQIANRKTTYFLFSLFYGQIGNCKTRYTATVVNLLFHFTTVK